MSQEVDNDSVRGYHTRPPPSYAAHASEGVVHTHHYLQERTSLITPRNAVGNSKIIRKEVQKKAEKDYQNKLHDAFDNLRRELGESGSKYELINKAVEELR